MVKLTIEKFINKVIRKYEGKGTLEREDRIVHDNIHLVLIYRNDPEFIPSKKSSDEMTMDELMNMCKSRKHVATFNVSTKKATYFEV